MDENWTKVSIELAEAHVDWYLKSIRQLLIDHMVHGFKHGMQYATTKATSQPAVEAAAESCGCEQCAIQKWHGNFCSNCGKDFRTA